RAPRRRSRANRRDLRSHRQPRARGRARHRRRRSRGARPRHGREPRPPRRARALHAGARRDRAHGPRRRRARRQAHGLRRRRLRRRPRARRRARRVHPRGPRRRRPLRGAFRGEGMSRAVACANIALAKYWGKSDVALNLPAVPSLSLTLEGLETHTEVTLTDASIDEVVLDGTIASEKETKRVTKMLDRVRALAGSERRARVVTENRFPTASGLASSASGFAALAGAACAAYGVDADEALLSRLVRAASASAARSIFGGFARLPASVPDDDSLAAGPLFGPEHWDARLVIAL